MKKHTYHIITIGCQMNVSDSERIAGCLEELGFVRTEKREKANTVIVTTCGVRQSAEDRAYGIIPKIKKANSSVKIVLTGCLAGRADVQKRLKDSVDIWLPINELAGLGKILRKRLEIAAPLARLGARNDRKGSLGGYLKINPKYESPISAFVPIGNGCNNYCAYCVVPYARGREVYRPAEDILAEVKGLIKKGYKEVILIAQNVNSYRSSVITQKTTGSSRRRFAPPQDDSGVVNFADLLKMVNDIPGDFWIRFATSHPKDMSEELIKTIAEREKVCQQIHLPAQAGDNKVLARMNRKYTREHYLGLIKKIRKNLPDTSISTDVIVGFPGETRKQFQNTEKLFRQAKFDQAFISQYSPRPGTAAAKLKNNVVKTEKKRREEALMKVLRRTALANNKKYIGKNTEVLFEGTRKGIFFGKTGTGKNVRIKDVSGRPVGKFFAVKIKSAKDFGLEGVFGK